MKKLVAVILAAIVVISFGWWFRSRGPLRVFPPQQHAAGAPDRPFSYENYRAVLLVHVDPHDGSVDYQALKANRDRLDAFAAELERLPSAVYSRWNEQEKIALWINAYNALTLEAIISNYPIRASFFRSVVFPENSIRQIPGVWNRLQFVVMGELVTLYSIEHEILRKQFNEPRVHMALVCASRGCPPLRNEPFTGDQLQQQLLDQTRKFLSSPTRFRIERENRCVYLSPIFEWFGIDFVKTYGANAKFSQRVAERAVLNFVARHVDDRDREYLTQEKYVVKYLGYDWSLNERAPAKPVS